MICATFPASLPFFGHYNSVTCWNNRIWLSPVEGGKGRGYSFMNAGVNIVRINKNILYHNNNHRCQCDVILWVICQTSALNHAHRAYFTSSIGRPRCLTVFSPFLSPRSSDFRRVAPLHCSLQGKHVDLVASTEGVYILKHFIQTI